MECDFWSGQEVVCINDDPNIPPNHPSNSGGLDGLTAGQHYHVERIFIDIDTDLVCISVVEIDRGHRGGFFAFRFRPVIKKTTDISELTKLLVPKEKVLEEV